jgi:multisubunit Na+/H+ antiporter MnhB subunit
MLQFAIVMYGFLLMFVLFSASRNKREGRSNSRMLTGTGYVLCGISAGAATLLPLWALYDPVSAVALAQISI